MATAVVLIADLVSTLAESHPVAMFGFFTGLIAASAITSAGAHVHDAPSRGDRDCGCRARTLVAADLVTLPGRVRRDPRRRRDRRQRDDPAGNLRFAHPDTARPVHLPLSSELSAFVRALGDLLGDGSLAAVIDPGTTVVLFLAGGVVGPLPSPASCVSRWPATAS